MFFSKIKWAALAAVATGFAFTSAAVLGRQDAASKPAAPAEDEEKPDAATILARRRQAVGLNREIPELDLDRGNDPRSHRIIARLEDPIAMSFKEETPLDDVLKYIKQATTTPTHSGIPIYVDPIGLQEAERSLNSTVLIDLEDVPLRRTLQLILSQLGLAYFVEDGILVITSPKRASDPLPPTITTLAPIHKMIEKAERGELSSTELKELVEVIRLRRMVKLMDKNYDAPAPGDEGHTGPGGAFRKREGVFPGEENARETRELLQEVRELVKVLKGDKPEKKAAEKQGGLQ